MERRMLLAVVLSILAVISYSALTGRGCVPPPPAKEDGAEKGAEGDPEKKGDDKAEDNGTGPGASAKKGDAPPPKKGDTPKPPPGADAKDHPQHGGPSRRATLASDELTATFTTQGGAIESLQLKNAFEEDRETPLDLVVPADPLMLMGQIDDTGLVPPAAPGQADRENMTAGPMRSPDLPWTLASATADEVVFTFQTTAGLVYTKRWSLVPGKARYDVVLRLSVAAAEGAADVPETVAVKLLAASNLLRERTSGAFTTPNGVLFRLSDTADASDEFPHGLPIKEMETKGINRARVRMLAARTAYFMSAYYSAGTANDPAITHYWATGEDSSLRGEMEENLRTWYEEHRDVDLSARADLTRRLKEGVPHLNHIWMALQLPVGAPEPVELKFYVGPRDRETLAQEPYQPLEPVITYPNAADFVADILMWIYDFWRGLFGSAGVAVILMTLCVRGGMMPLSVRNQLSMRKYGRKVAKLKPKVKKLQTQYANNPKKLREEQMKLYKQHGVGFPTGCLMMLIQIPIFFALFSSLRVEYTIRGESFLWINDLSGPDKLIDFGGVLFDILILRVESLNVLPLLMVVLSIMHTRNMPKPADEQQAQQMKMMKWLPIIFAVILYNYTAALAIYMVLSSAVAIVESKIVRARDEADEAAEAPPA